jgi:MFS family permease
MDESRLGLLLLLPPLFGVPAALSGSRIVARFGSPTLLVVGSAIVAAGLAVLAGADGTATPWIAMAVAGVGSGMIDVAVLTAASRVQSAGGTPVLGRVQAFFFVGLVAGGGVGVAVVGLGLSYRWSFVVTAVVLLAACVLAARQLVLPPASTTTSGHLSIRGVVAIAGVPVLITIAFGGFFLEGATTSFAAVLLRNAIGSTAVVASTAAFVVTVGLAIGAGAADALSARIGPQRTMALGGAVAAAGVAAAATATLPATAVAGLGIAAVGFGGIGPAALTLTAPIDHRYGGGVLPTVTALSYVAFLFGPVAVGQLGELFGLRIAFGVVAAAAGALAVVSLVGMRPQAAA